MIDGSGILQLRFPRTQGCCCEPVFRRDEGDCE
jgi:hypothetical protein